MPQETQNRVFRALPHNEREEVLARCEHMELESRKILARVGEVANAVYFPETAVISTIATYSDGSSIEMANIGRESCTGVGLTLGHPRQLNTNEVQIGGRARVMSADAFAELRGSLPAFEQVVRSAVQAIFYQVMVSGACNGAHGVRQRLARWLLTMRDRNDDETMPLTHDFLAEMLGVRRATVTEASRDLQAQGLIAYSRGQMRITDIPRMQQTSCECYFLVRDAYEALLPASKNGH